MAADGNNSAPEDKKKRSRAAQGELPIDGKRLEAIIHGIEAGHYAHILPDDIGLPVLKAHLDKVRTSRAADTDALLGRKGSVRTLADLESEASETLRRLELLLAGQFPSGSVARVAFFPVGPGPHDELVRLDAFLNGWARHPLHPASVPPALQHDKVQALRHALAAARDAKAKAVRTKDGTAPARVAVSTVTRALLRRTSDFLRGYFGESGHELALFGLKVRRRGR